MKLQKMLLMVSIMFLLVSSATVAVAGDFDWLKDLSIKAAADPSGFKAQLAARFKVGETMINTVLSNVDKPADAYMVMRLGEMADKPTDYVIEKYKSEKNKGWGVLAKSLGIKPGSQEFHALKRGHDLYDNKTKVKSKGAKVKTKSKK